MEKPKFEFYTRPNGHNEFLEFYSTLPLKDQQKLLATINRIEKDGLLIAQRLELVKNWTMKYTKYAQSILTISKEPYIFMQVIINIS